MANHENLEKLSREELISLIDLYSKSWLAMDGVWFQSIERELGMDAAIHYDEEAWKRYTVIEAKRIKEFLKLEEHPGLKGLEEALKYRFYGNLNENHFSYEEDGSLVYTVAMCRVQHARTKKGMPLHPCKSVAIYEYTGFASIIDSRIQTECLSCFPDVTDNTCSCSWRFSIA